MPRDNKSKYTPKQKRQAHHIEDQYKDSGISNDEAERRAWATVNKTTGGGRKSGSGRGRARNTSSKGRKHTGKRSTTARKSSRSNSRTSGRSTR